MSDASTSQRRHRADARRARDREPAESARAEPSRAGLERPAGEPAETAGRGAAIADEQEPDVASRTRRPSDPFDGWPAAESAAVIEDVAGRRRERRARRAARSTSPTGYTVLEGTPLGNRRSVGVVVSRFNGGVTNRMLARALDALDEAGVAPERSRSCPCPARSSCRSPRWRSRRRAATPASSRSARSCAARRRTSTTSPPSAPRACSSPAIETGVPVAFGVLTVENVEQAEARIDKAADAVRSALEMADLFARLRASATAPYDGSAATHPARPMSKVCAICGKKPGVREPPLALDGRDEAPLRPEPPARPRAPERLARRAPTSAPAASRAARCRRPSSNHRPARFGV